MDFFCVYVKTRKKLDKYVKTNHIKNKSIIDLRKILEDEELNFTRDKTYLKILINQKVQQALEKSKDIYYIPDFDNEFSVEKLLNIKQLLESNHNFNILVFYNDFRKDSEILSGVFENLTKFDNSQIIRDY
jgi:hypothetical protein